MKAANMFKQAGTTAHHRLKRLFDLVSRATRSFSDARAPEAASSMAFYALFSLFPLLVVLIVIASFFVENQQAFDVVIRLLGQLVPVSRDSIQDIISGVLQERGTMTLIGLLGLVFSASSLFSAVTTHINRAWPTAPLRTFLGRHLAAMAIVGMAIVLLVILILVRAVLELLARINVLSLYNTPTSGQIPLLAAWLTARIPSAARWFLSTLSFLALYRWVPKTRVPWRSAFWAALVAGAAWELASMLFTWYLGTGLVRYDLIYGSLGAIIALMVWFYLTAWIFLFGAHLSAAIGEHNGSLTPLEPDSDQRKQLISTLPHKNAGHEHPSS
jgi:membrane protein